MQPVPWICTLGWSFTPAAGELVCQRLLQVDYVLERTVLSSQCFTDRSWDHRRGRNCGRRRLHKSRLTLSARVHVCRCKHRG
jgi:hypothetical protein